MKTMQTFKILAALAGSYCGSALAGEWQVTLLKGTTSQKPTPIGTTLQEAWDNCLARIPATAVPDATWKCQTPVYVAKVTKPPPTTPPPPPPPPPPITDWNFCADEGATCTVPAGGRTVRYGFEPGWVQKPAPAGPMQCASASFVSASLPTGDPAPSKFKVCQYAGIPAPAGTGTASLSWGAPTTDVDGKPITGELRYAIYHNGFLAASVTGRTYQFTGLTPGKHDFAVTASVGISRESEPATGSKVIP
jgi:hypothetical protein